MAKERQTERKGKVLTPPSYALLVDGIRVKAFDKLPPASVRRLQHLKGICFEPPLPQPKEKPRGNAA